MHRSTITFVFLALFMASSALAISPGDDLLIAGAARTPSWTADLYINNPGATGVTVQVWWLNRDPSITNPAAESFSIGAGETLILDDVLLNVFGLSEAEGAFRVTAADGEVTANLIVFTGAGSEDGTYGSGFEGIPASSATSAGESTTITGLVLNGSFRTNLFALAGANGVIMDIDLLDTNGNLLDTEQVVLTPYEPWFSSVANLWDVASFENGTARVVVDEGSMVMLGSKVDRLSKDPTTVEQAFGAGGGSVDGIYQFAVYDDLGFASGGNLEIVDAVVDVINGTFVNYDKLDGGGIPECPVIFQWGFDLAPTPVEDFASGVEDVEVYPPDPPELGDFEGGTLTYTLTFTFYDSDNLGFSGTLDAVGSEFSGLDAGCNGTFPGQKLYGGKSN
jgi:hypothetical protein